MKPCQTVVFICSANLCRSLMAQAILSSEARRRKLTVRILSAGMYDFEGVSAAREARFCCERHKTPLVNFVSTYFRKIDLSNATRVLAMTREHVELLSQELPALSARISLLGKFDPKKRGDEIEDPMGKDNVAFDFCYERLRDCINHYIDSTVELA